MRRFLVLLLLASLPWQFAWSAAAVYCTHEASSSNHFGHHLHAHKAAPGSSEDAGKSSSTKLTLDSDCSVCHLVAPTLVANASALIPAADVASHPVGPPDPFRSAIEAFPERPDRSHLLS